MKYAKPSGRLLADVGEGLKRRLYKILFDKNITYKDWLKDAIQRYVKTWESEVKE